MKRNVLQILQFVTHCAIRSRTRTIEVSEICQKGEIVCTISGSHHVLRSSSEHTQFLQRESPQVQRQAHDCNATSRPPLSKMDNRDQQTLQNAPQPRQTRTATRTRALEMDREPTPAQNGIMETTRSKYKLVFFMRFVFFCVSLPTIVHLLSVGFGTSPCVEACDEAPDFNPWTLLPLSCVISAIAFAFMHCHGGHRVAGRAVADAYGHLANPLYDFLTPCRSSEGATAMEPSDGGANSHAGKLHSVTHDVFRMETIKLAETMLLLLLLLLIELVLFANKSMVQKNTAVVLFAMAGLTLILVALVAGPTGDKHLVCIPDKLHPYKALRNVDN